MLSVLFTLEFHKLNSPHSELFLFAESCKCGDNGFYLILTKLRDNTVCLTESYNVAFYGLQRPKVSISHRLSSELNSNQFFRNEDGSVKARCRSFDSFDTSSTLQSQQRWSRMSKEKRKYLGLILRFLYSSCIYLYIYKCPSI